MINKNIIYESYLDEYTKDIITYYKLIRFSSIKVDEEYWKKRINKALNGFIKSTGMLR